MTCRVLHDRRVIKNKQRCEWFRGDWQRTEAVGRNVALSSPSHFPVLISPIFFNIQASGVAYRHVAGMPVGISTGMCAGMRSCTVGKVLLEAVSTSCWQACIHALGFPPKPQQKKKMKNKKWIWCQANLWRARGHALHAGARTQFAIRARGLLVEDRARLCHLSLCHLSFCHLLLWHLSLCHLSVCHLSLCHLSLCHLSLCHMSLCHLSVCHLSLCHVPSCHMSLCHLSLCHLSLCHLSLCHLSWHTCSWGAHPARSIRVRKCVRKHGMARCTKTRAGKIVTRVMADMIAEGKEVPQHFSLKW